MLYLLKEGGSPDHCRRAMDFANGLLRAGGLAVNVERSASRTVRPTGEMSERKTGLTYIREFVVVAMGEETTYSCGMHNFGLRDAVVASKLSPTRPPLVNRFIVYVLAEQPRLGRRDVSVAMDAPHYRLSAEPCTKFAANDAFHNPTVCGG